MVMAKFKYEKYKRALSSLQVRLNAKSPSQQFQKWERKPLLKQEPVKPGNAPRIGIGHREIICQKWL